MSFSLSRRRFLSIAAAGALAPGTAQAETHVRRTGRALGASTSLRLVNTSPAEADATVAAVEAELARLERIFSLYDPRSQLATLNADGRLEHPAPELLEVLSLCTGIHHATDGLFDPTVQPLWMHRAGQAWHDRPEDLIGWRHVHVESHQIRFAKAGMQLTLNGIAQGYITDRIASLLRGRGLQQVMIDMGEIAAIGSKENKTPWSVGVAGPGNQVVARLQLTDRALATSAPGTLILDANRHISHILNPHGKSSGPLNELVAISSPSAALADGLSTAGCLMSKPQLLSAVGGFPSTRLEVMI